MEADGRREVQEADGNVMISVEYVPSLTSAEEDSHRQFHEVVDRLIGHGPDFLFDNKSDVERFAAAIWAAAFKRAEEVLAQEK